MPVFSQVLAPGGPAPEGAPTWNGAGVLPHAAHAASRHNPLARIDAAAPPQEGFQSAPLNASSARIKLLPIGQTVQGPPDQPGKWKLEARPLQAGLERGLGRRGGVFFFVGRFVDVVVVSDCSASQAERQNDRDPP